MDVRVGPYGVHRASGTADSENIRVGAPADLDGIDIQHIDRRATARFEIAEGNIRRSHATNPVGVEGIELRVVDCHLVAVEGKGGVVARALGAGLVGEDVVHVEQRQVHHLLFGDDRDRGGNVLELRVHAGTRHRICAIVARVLF